MKVRIADQQIVFRLNEEEKNKFVQDRKIEVILNLRKKTLGYALELSSKLKAMNFKYKKGTLTILIPDFYMDKWDKLKVGFEETLQFGEDEEIELIVEKDLLRSKKK
jgi:hypothetical protein